MSKIDSIWSRRFLKLLTLKSIIGMVLGVLGGYIYYIQVGCESGSCPITSSPWLSMLWGLLMGYLVGDMFNKTLPKEEKKSTNK